MYLLDTHYMIWAITDTEKLSVSVKDTLTNPENKILVSAVSFWEISLKSSIGKLEISGFKPEDFPDFCRQVGFEIKPLTARECSTYHQLSALHHKDPFDRMLIWQAVSNNYTLITADAQIRKYSAEGLLVF